MGGNKSVKNALIKRYGAECFIEKLHLRDTSKIQYRGVAQRHRMKKLTYHHIRKRSKGGKATVENGALLSAENHAWFHKQPKESQELMNKMFQQYKREADGKIFDRVTVEIVDFTSIPISTTVKAIFIDAKELKRRSILKERMRIKRELQRLKKEWEDR